MWDVYLENYLLPSKLTIAYKIRRFWKFQELVEVCGILDAEGALSSNISRGVVIPILMTPVWETLRHKIVRECDNMAVF